MSNAVKALQAVRVAALAALLGMPAQAAVAQENAITMPLNDAALVQPRHVTVKATHYRGSDALEVRQTGPYIDPRNPLRWFFNGCVEIPLQWPPSGSRSGRWN